jgi:uncharacterized protein (DUF169 family)
VETETLDILELELRLIPRVVGVGIEHDDNTLRVHLMTDRPAPHAPLLRSASEIARHHTAGKVVLTVSAPLPEAAAAGVVVETGRFHPVVLPWADLSERLVKVLRLATAPVAISFSATSPPGVEPFDAPMAPATEDGRHGRVPAGCVFWTHGTERTFSTVAEDHGNCSVGSVTHGLLAPQDVLDHSDVAELVGVGWVGPDLLEQLPKVEGRPGAVVYGPLGDSPIAPDVVLLRVNARQLMVLSDALPALSIQGKPQCHVVALAKEQGIPAASVGCALSRQRTGMRPDEMSCALPAAQLGSIVAAVEKAAGIDAAVGRYAAEDARRFA